MRDPIDRRAAIDALEKEKPTPFVNEDGSIDPFGAGQQNQWYRDGIAIMNLPSAQPEIKPVDIDYYYCSNAMLKMWIDNVLTDGQYNRIMDKLNDFERKRREKENG